MKTESNQNDIVFNLSDFALFLSVMQKKEGLSKYA